MVIDQIDVGDVFAVKYENQPPITRNPNHPLSLTLALELVQPVTRKVHIGRFLCPTQRSQQDAQPDRLLRIDSPSVTALKNRASPLCRIRFITESKCNPSLIRYQ